MNESTQLKNLGFVVIREAIDTKTLGYIKADAVCVFAKQMQRHKIQTGSFEADLIKFHDEFFNEFDNCLYVVQSLFSLHQLAVSKTIQDISYRLKLGFPIIDGPPRLYVHSHRLETDEILSDNQQTSLNSIDFLIPLTEGDSLGSMTIVPGSHKEEKPKYDHESSVTVPLNLGDVLAYSSRAKIWMEPNAQNERLRWTINFRIGDINDPCWLRNGYDHWIVSDDNANAQEIADLFS